jgi:cytoskeletal protein RodZ
MDVHLSDPDLSPRGSGAPPTLDDGNATVGQMLRGARERRGLTLQAIAASTHIPLKHLSALERDDLAAVPPGFYQRAEIRTFADTVGLDPRLALGALERGRSAASASLPARPASGTIAASASRRASPAASGTNGVAPGVAVRKPASSVQAQSGTRPLTMVIGALAIVIAAGFTLRSLLTVTPAPSPATPTERADAVPPPAPAQPAIEASRVGTEASRVSTTEAAATAPATQTTPSEPASAAVAPVDFPELRITSEPSGARVTIDGIGWGQTPLTVRYLEPGSKRIRVTMDGYFAQEQVAQLSSGTPTTTVRISLRRRP